RQRARVRAEAHERTGGRRDDRRVPRRAPRRFRGRQHRAGRAGCAGRTGRPGRMTVASTVPVLRKALKAKAPGLARERALWAEGHDIVVGLDEVGRGAWAGPLTIGAAVVPKDRRINKVRDSKMLTEAEREAMFDRVAGWCEAWAV